MLILISFAFLSGIVTILSPCILPVLPIVLSGSVGGKRRPLGVITGFIVSFSIFTLLLTAFVRFLNIPADSLRVVAVILLILFGLIMVIPKLTTAFEVFASRLTGRSQKKKTASGFTGGVLVGFSLGLVWTPCVGPIMASVISLAITQSVDSGSVFIILAYSLGTSIPMLAIMLGGRSLIKRFPRLSGNSGKIQKVFGVLMIVMGISISVGADRKFQSIVLDLFPNYGSGLTVFENIKPVQDAIKARDTTPPPMMAAGSTQVSFDVQPKDGILGDYGPAPEIVTMGNWLNTDGKSLTMEDLKGKVVLVDFWTYSCINCVRTIPHIQSWYEAYRDEGLVVIGVHTPEFAFERDEENLREAMADLGVTWPVVQDNEYSQWQAYRNRYWPAKYFIDATGTIRYFHYGEGEYDTSEEVIRKLLKEAGNLPTGKAALKPEAHIRSRTAETYLGYGRTEGFISKEQIAPNESLKYSRNKSPENGEWNLDGTWTFKREHVLSENEGTLELGFNAGKVFLVIEPVDTDGRIEIEVDGKSVGELKPDSSRLYQLVDLRKPGVHSLKLKVYGKMKLFAFTFG